MRPQDQVRKDAIELLGEANKLLVRTERCVKNAGKQLDKAVKKTGKRRYCKNFRSLWRNAGLTVWLRNSSQRSGRRRKNLNAVPEIF